MRQGSLSWAQCLSAPSSIVSSLTYHSMQCRQAGMHLNVYPPAQRRSCRIYTNHWYVLWCLIGLRVVYDASLVRQVTCLNGHGGERCPGYEFKTTAPPSSPASESRIRPGDVQQYICLYNKAIDEGPYTMNGDAIAPLGYSELLIDATHIDCFSYPPITQDELMDRSSYQSTVDTSSEDESTWK